LLNRNDTQQQQQQQQQTITTKFLSLLSILSRHFPRKYLTFFLLFGFFKKEAAFFVIF